MKLISDQCNEFTIRGFALGIADGIAEEALEGVQVATIPGDFDGVADGSFDTGRGGLEGFGDLWVQYLGDGISLACGQQGVRLTAQRKMRNVND